MLSNLIFNGEIPFLPENVREAFWCKLLLGLLFIGAGFFIDHKYVKLAMVTVGLLVFIRPGISDFFYGFRKKGRD